MEARRERFWLGAGRWCLLAGFAFFVWFYAALLHGMGPTTPAFHAGYFGFASLALMTLALHQLRRARARLLFFGLLFGCLTLAAVMPSSRAEWELRRLRPGMTRVEAADALSRWQLTRREVSVGPAGRTWTRYYQPRDTPRIDHAALKFADDRLVGYEIGWD